MFYELFHEVKAFFTSDDSFISVPYGRHKNTYSVTKAVKFISNTKHVWCDRESTLGALYIALLNSFVFTILTVWEEQGRWYLRKIYSTD